MNPTVMERMIDRVRMLKIIENSASEFELDSFEYSVLEKSNPRRSIIPKIPKEKDEEFLAKFWNLVTRVRK